MTEFLTMLAFTVWMLAVIGLGALAIAMVVIGDHPLRGLAVGTFVVLLFAAGATVVAEHDKRVIEHGCVEQ